MPAAKNISGRRNGKLIAVRRISFNEALSRGLHYPSGHGVRWLCHCNCGNDVVVPAGRFCMNSRNSTKSCGCLRSEKSAESNRTRLTTHGMTSTSTWTTWSGMRGRCFNKKNEKYPRYGGRGITVCDRWRNSFENFLADMGPRPDGTSLDRIDNNGNYSPENCRWASPSEQQNNKSTTVWITYQGRRMTLSQWARELDVELPTLHYAIKRELLNRMSGGKNG